MSAADAAGGRDFSPCRGKTGCRETADGCTTCGRSRQEIDRLRELMGQLADFAVSCEYRNLDAFARYVASRISKMVEHRQAQAADVPH